MTPPVVFLIFNRPDVTARTFAAIRQARPRQLLIVADAPRPGRPGEDQLCAEARRIVEAVDWPCEVRRNYAQANMGCGRRIGSGITWAFEQVEEAIFLEDDCLPDPSFFAFCGEMLARYRDDERVMAISGDNFHGGRRYGEADYFFSRYQHIWGWASWRRAWRHYDFGMTRWPALRQERFLEGISRDPLIQDYWRNNFDRVAAGEVDTWDYQWLFSAWVANGLSITPNVNLIANIGFGPDATHTTEANDRMLPQLGRMTFPMRHPSQVVPCDQADRYEERQLFLRWRTRIKMRLRAVLGRFAPRRAA
jgi:hypothetical protein